MGWSAVQVHGTSDVALRPGMGSVFWCYSSGTLFLATKCLEDVETPCKNLDVVLLDAPCKSAAHGESTFVYMLSMCVLCTSYSQSTKKRRLGIKGDAPDSHVALSSFSSSSEGSDTAGYSTRMSVRARSFGNVSLNVSRVKLEFTRRTCAAAVDEASRRLNGAL